MVEIRCLVEVVQNIGVDRSGPGFICCACMDKKIWLLKPVNLNPGSVVLQVVFRLTPYMQSTSQVDFLVCLGLSKKVLFLGHQSNDLRSAFVTCEDNHIAGSRIPRLRDYH